MKALLPKAPLQPLDNRRLALGGNICRTCILLIWLWMLADARTALAAPRGRPAIPAPNETRREKLHRIANSTLFGSERFGPIAEVALSDTETTELLGIYDQATSAVANAVGSGKRSALIVWADSLEAFVAKYPDSAYNPGARLQLASHYIGRIDYSRAIDHLSRAYQETVNRPEGPAVGYARDAAKKLATLLAYSGQTEAFDQLYAAESKKDPERVRRQWMRAIETRQWNPRYAAEAYKCGVLAIEQVARITHPNEYLPSGLFMTANDPNGYDAATLLRIAGKNGLNFKAIKLADLGTLPVPSVMHLKVGHYVAVRRKDGDFYEVQDALRPTVDWLTADEIASDASGVFLVSDRSDLRGVASFQTLDDATAATYRGRCYHGTPWDELAPPSCDTCPCGPGSNSQPAGPSARGCSSCGVGMPAWWIDEPYLNLWMQDTPLSYQPLYGPKVDFGIRFQTRNNSYGLDGESSFLPKSRIHALFDDYAYTLYSTWLSWLVYDYSSGNPVHLQLPGGGFMAFTFVGSATASDTNYWTHSWLEKRLSGTTVTGFWLHKPDGSRIEYMQTGLDNGYASGWYMTAQRDPQGLATTFAYYDSSSYLTNVVAADGTSFAVTHNQTGGFDVDPSEPIAQIVGSNGAVVSFGYDETNALPDATDFTSHGLSSITDAAGIKTYLYLDIVGTNYIQTPYGRTMISVQGTGDPSTFTADTVERWVDIFHPDGSTEAYASMTQYTGSDWPNWTLAEIPQTSTAIVSTLDTTERQSRNTFYWPPQTRSVMTKDFSTAPTMAWADFKLSRIRHWLTHVEDYYTHWGTISWEQSISPNGSALGDVVWYDYIAKPAGENDNRGTESLPAVEARVMPDTSTWYRSTTRNSLGQPTQIKERWYDGSGYQTRTDAYAYSSDGIDLLVHTNALGVVQERYGYDSQHRLTKATNAVSEITSYTYDSQSRVTAITYPSGLAVANTYTGGGLTKTSVGSLGSSPYRTNVTTQTLGVSYSRTGLNGTTIAQPTTWVVNTDERGLVTTNIYDGLNRLWERRKTGALTEYWHYELWPGESYSSGAGGKLILEPTALVNALSKTNRISYDSRRRVASRVNENGVVTAYTYCTCGSPTGITEAQGTGVAQTTSHDYDYQGKRWRTTLADGTIATNYFDSIGRLVIVQTPVGYNTNAYDNLGRLAAGYNSAGIQFAKAFDALDQVTIFQNANGTLTTNVFDNLGRTTATLQNGITNNYGFTTGFGAVTAWTNGTGNVTLWAFDAAQRKTNEIQVGVWTNSFAYLPAGDLRYLWDGKANRTEWRYDVFGRVSEKWYQGQTNCDLVYTYDAAGRMTNRFTRTSNPGTNGYNTRYTYDAVGNLTNVVYPTSTALAFAFDALNRVQTMTDAAGTTTYTYSLLGGGLSTVAEDGPWSSDTVTVTNRFGLRSGLLVAQPTGSFATTYAWDAARRLTNVTGSGQVFGYRYAGTGPLIGRTDLPGGPYVTNTFDSLGRLTSTDLRTSGGTTLDIYGYAYDAADRRSQATRTNTLATSWNGHLDYGYDSGSELVGSKTYDGSGTEVPADRRGYLYDAAQNLSQKTNNAAVTAWTVNALNELNATPSWTSTYDRRGNITTLSQSGYSQTYTWDDENQLLSAQTDLVNTPVGSRWKVDFVYDGLRRLRVWRSYSYNTTYMAFMEDSQTRYLYDGMLIVQERNAGNVPQVHYTRGTDLGGSLAGAGGIGGLLLRSSGYSAGSWSTQNAYHADGNGNITALVNGSGTLQAVYKYDPFGNLLGSSGSLAAANAMRFSSRPVILTTGGNFGMVYYGYRFYDPQNQRWLNRDPLSNTPRPAVLGIHFPLNWMIRRWEAVDGPNVYTMVHNNTVGYTDVNGLVGFGVTGGGSIEGGIGIIGAGATGSGGFGAFWGGPGGLNLGGWLAGGLFERIGTFTWKCPRFAPQPPWVVGAYAGLGLGPYLTNAKSESDLSGPFDQYNINTPIGSINFGVGGGTWIASVTLGPGAGGSISGYPTFTWP